MIFRQKFIAILLVFFALSFCESRMYSQNLLGTISDKNRDPIYGATIFIREANQGLACNEQGEFQAMLPVGKYTLEYRALGYVSLIDTISIKKNETTKREIILSERLIELAEVTVLNNEDPAYEIMRNAIKQASFHSKKVKGYEAEVYIKGNMELTKVPKIVNKLTSVEGMKLSDFKGKLFLQESYNTIKFTAPEKFEQTVKAFSSSIPDNFNPDDAMSIMQGSLYFPRFSGMISPLNPKAFSYYKYRYEGFYEEDGEVINKIKVMPKLKDPELMSGYIYIADNVWDIRYAKFEGNMYGIHQKFTITFNEISPTVFLPTTYSNKLDANILGVSAYFNYYSSLKYSDIIINESIDEEKEVKKKKDNFEIYKEDNYSIKTDSLATRRDSIYWGNIRNIPLTQKEEISYDIKDSVQHHVDSLRGNYHNRKFKATDLLIGGHVGGDSATVTFRFGGMLRGLRNYNFVDGFGLGQKFSINKKWNDFRHNLILAPEIYYATASKQVRWQTDFTFEYSPMKLGKFTVSGGNTIADYNPIGIVVFDNMTSSLLWGDNVIMLYNKKYIEVNNEIDLANGLRLTTRAMVAKRNELDNATNYSLFGRESDAKPNVNPQREFGIVTSREFNLTSYGISVEYTPKSYYSVRKGKKTYRYAKSPTYGIEYSEGFSSWQTNNSKYRKVKLSVSQSIRTDLFSRFDYSVDGGTFVGRKDKVAFADYEHFRTSDLFFITQSPFDAFMLLDSYEPSTNKYWVQAKLNYYSKYILLKRLPFLQGKLFNEAIHLKYLHTPNKKNYSEIGYSIDLFKKLTLGGHCAFSKFQYESARLRLTLNLNFF